MGKLFGRQALEDPTPGGLKRLSDEAAKELYPAATDCWAAPVPGDSEDVAVLRPLLAQTQLESKPLRLAYDADRDGWSADAFHLCVDGFGAALVVAQTGVGLLHGCRQLLWHPACAPTSCMLLCWAAAQREAR